VESDVEGAKSDLDAREVRDQSAQALSKRNSSRVDADQSGAVEVGIALDDLVRDTGDRPAERLRVEKDLSALLALFGRRRRRIWRTRSHEQLLSGLTGPS
jgi:hypothetical protein